MSKNDKNKELTRTEKRLRHAWACGEDALKARKRILRGCSGGVGVFNGYRRRYRPESGGGWIDMCIVPGHGYLASVVNYTGGGLAGLAAAAVNFGGAVSVDVMRSQITCKGGVEKPSEGCGSGVVFVFMDGTSIRLFSVHSYGGEYSSAELSVYGTDGVFIGTAIKHWAPEKPANPDVVGSTGNNMVTGNMATLALAHGSRRESSLLRFGADVVDGMAVFPDGSIADLAATAPLVVSIQGMELSAAEEVQVAGMDGLAAISKFFDGRPIRSKTASGGFISVTTLAGTVYGFTSMPGGVLMTKGKTDQVWGVVMSQEPATHGQRLVCLLYEAGLEKVAAYRFVKEYCKGHGVSVLMMSNDGSWAWDVRFADGSRVAMAEEVLSYRPGVAVEPQADTIICGVTGFRSLKDTVQWCARHPWVAFDVTKNRVDVILEAGLFRYTGCRKSGIQVYRVSDAPTKAPLWDCVVIYEFFRSSGIGIDQWYAEAQKGSKYVHGGQRSWTARFADGSVMCVVLDDRPRITLRSQRTDDGRYIRINLPTSDVGQAWGRIRQGLVSAITNLADWATLAGGLSDGSEVTVATAGMRGVAVRVTGPAAMATTVARSLKGDPSEWFASMAIAAGDAERWRAQFADGSRLYLDDGVLELRLAQLSVKWPATGGGVAGNAIRNALYRDFESWDTLAWKRLTGVGSTGYYDGSRVHVDTIDGRLSIAAHGPVTVSSGTVMVGRTVSEAEATFHRLVPLGEKLVRWFDHIKAKYRTGNNVSWNAKFADGSSLFWDRSTASLVSMYLPDHDITIWRPAAACGSASAVLDRVLGAAAVGQVIMAITCSEMGGGSLSNGVMRYTDGSSLAIVGRRITLSGPPPRRVIIVSAHGGLASTEALAFSRAAAAGEKYKYASKKFADGTELRVTIRGGVEVLHVSMPPSDASRFVDEFVDGEVVLPPHGATFVDGSSIVVAESGVVTVASGRPVNRIVLEPDDSGPWMATDRVAELVKLPVTSYLREYAHVLGTSVGDGNDVVVQYVDGSSVKLTLINYDVSGVVGKAVCIAVLPGVVSDALRWYRSGAMGPFPGRPVDHIIAGVKVRGRAKVYADQSVAVWSPTGIAIYSPGSNWTAFGDHDAVLVQPTQAMVAFNFEGRFPEDGVMVDYKGRVVNRCRYPDGSILVWGGGMMAVLDPFDDTVACHEGDVMQVHRGASGRWGRSN